jgi:PAS domain S-box-containing protein
MMRGRIGRWASKTTPRLYFFLVALMLLPISFFAYTVANMLREQAMTQARREGSEIARVSSDLLAEHFRQSTAFLQSIATRRAFERAWGKRDAESLRAELQQASNLRPDFEFFGVFDSDGTTRAIYPPEPELLNHNFAFRDWYKGLTERKKPYISDVYQTAIPPFPLVTAIAVPIKKDDSGKITGILLAPFSVDSLNRQLGQAKFDGGWTISIVDRDGHLAARPNINSFSPPVDLSRYGPVKLVLGGQSGAGIFTRDQTRFFARYQPIAGWGWGVLVEKPAAVLEQNVWAVERGVWLLGFVFLVLGLGVSTFMGWLYSQFDKGNRFIELSMDMFCVAGFDGFFKSVNPAFERTLGFTAAEIMAKPYVEFVHPEDREATRRESSRLESGEVTFAFENRYLCQDNTYKWILWNAVSVPEKSLIYAVGRDITGRKRVEEERQKSAVELENTNAELEMRNREAERATRLKSKFLANMSHELRTPLNAIMGFSDLLAEGTAGKLNAKQERFVNHIKQGSNHLLQLINDILDLSKIEAGQLELRCEDFLVRDALPEVLSNIRPLAMAKNIEVEQKVEIEHTVFADRVRFKQILYNLLSNAVKFTPKAGKIEVACIEQGDFASISVTDTGVGIRAEDQSVIFEEFRQVDDPSGEKHEGTGLGLAITKRLVEQQKGQIVLESAPGRGSRFTFTMPLGAQTAGDQPLRQPAPDSRRPSSVGKPLVMIVDDEGPARELLASYLSPDYRIVMASSGAEALEKAQHLRPDAITLDVLMSGGNGFETLARVRQTRELANTPIIIVSIVDQQRVGFALGAADYLIKPIRKPLLLETLHKHVPSQPDDDDSILLVDDDPKTLELLTETLRSAGYETQSVHSGERALEVLSSKMVSAVMLDLLMPGMDGFEVIQHVRKEPTLKDLPIFVMTGKTLSSEESSLLAQETQALFHKNGACREQLISEVGRVLQSRKRAAAAANK